MRSILVLYVRLIILNAKMNTLEYQRLLNDCGGCRKWDASPVVPQGVVGRGVPLLHFLFVHFVKHSFHALSSLTTICELTWRVSSSWLA